MATEYPEPRRVLAAYEQARRALLDQLAASVVDPEAVRRCYDEFRRLGDRVDQVVTGLVNNCEEVYERLFGRLDEPRDYPKRWSMGQRDRWSKWVTVADVITRLSKRHEGARAVRSRLPTLLDELLLGDRPTEGLAELRTALDQLQLTSEVLEVPGSTDSEYLRLAEAVLRDDLETLQRSLPDPGLALKWAAKHGRRAVVEWLLDRDQVLRQPDSLTATIDVAISHGQFDLARWVAKRYHGRGSKNALLRAAFNDHLEAVKWLHLRSPKLFTEETVRMATMLCSLPGPVWSFLNGLDQ